MITNSNTLLHYLHCHCSHHRRSSRSHVVIVVVIIVAVIMITSSSLSSSSSSLPSLSLSSSLSYHHHHTTTIVSWWWGLGRSRSGELLRVTREGPNQNICSISCVMYSSTVQKEFSYEIHCTTAVQLQYNFLERSMNTVTFIENKANNVNFVLRLN